MQHAEDTKPATAPKTSGRRRRRSINPQPLHAAQISEALLRMKTAGELSGLSEATLYRRAATDPTFPPLIKMGLRCTRIRAGDLMAWLAKQG